MNDTIDLDKIKLELGNDLSFYENYKHAREGVQRRDYIRRGVRDKFGAEIRRQLSQQIAEQLEYHFSKLWALEQSQESASMGAKLIANPPPTSKLFNHMAKWTSVMDKELEIQYASGHTLRQIAEKHGRTGTSIVERLKKLGRIKWDEASKLYVHPLTGSGYAGEAQIAEVNAYMGTPNETLPNETNAAQTTKPTIKEQHMSTITIDNTAAFVTVSIDASNASKKEQVFIYGVEGDAVSDDKIFNHIARLEEKITSLDKIENKPQKLKDKIAGLRADIDKLVRYVDTRDVK